MCPGSYTFFQRSLSLVLVPIIQLKLCTDLRELLTSYRHLKQSINNFRLLLPNELSYNILIQSTLYAAFDRSIQHDVVVTELISIFPRWFFIIVHRKALKCVCQLISSLHRTYFITLSKTTIAKISFFAIVDQSTQHFHF